MSTNYPDTISEYGYELLARNPNFTSSVRCTACGATFKAADGSIMRGHALRCSVNPRTYKVPGVCWS